MARKSDKPKVESLVCAELKYQCNSPANGYDARCYTVLINGRCGIGVFSSCDSEDAVVVRDAVNNYVSCVAEVRELKEQVRKLRARLRKASRRADG